ncbi:hypothetical protein PMAYCL1PPCAC_30196 [Pristionchus mayeri]|uniref:Uncharacterized protein n=1 Tax=Pristionchus mayeri TaxID=1317129 RepID=A0AAN5IET9_9BILA|nr:hypothetical protein PMAYCL1PPCAC_30196 [Pristionchus mayeri]
MGLDQRANESENSALESRILLAKELVSQADKARSNASATIITILRRDDRIQRSCRRITLAHSQNCFNFLSVVQQFLESHVNAFNQSVCELDGSTFSDVIRFECGCSVVKQLFEAQLNLSKMKIPHKYIAHRAPPAARPNCTLYFPGHR